MGIIYLTNPNIRAIIYAMESTSGREERREA
jgi:hypothetical protein